MCLLEIDESVVNRKYLDFHFVLINSRIISHALSCWENNITNFANFLH